MLPQSISVPKQDVRFKGWGRRVGGHSSPCSAENYSYTLLLETYFPENIAKEENNIMHGNSLGGKATINMTIFITAGHENVQFQ